jgi:hypothetical protein
MGYVSRSRWSGNHAFGKRTKLVSVEVFRERPPVLAAVIAIG